MVVKSSLMGAHPTPEIPALCVTDDERAAAGRELAEQLRPFYDSSGLVLALVPGGVAVAGEVARALRLPLDVLVARTFVVPSSSLVAGALCEERGLCFNGAVRRLPEVAWETMWEAARHAREEVLDLTNMYRHGRPLPVWRRRQVVLVDDGLGSGLAQLAALQVVRRGHPQSCIVASPSATPAAIQRVARWADVMITSTCRSDTQTELSPWKKNFSHLEASLLLEQYRQIASRLRQRV